MIKYLVISALIALALSNQHLNNQYSDLLHGREPFSLGRAKEVYEQYKSPLNEKSPYRFMVFVETLKEIIEHNKGGHSWKQGINQFTDMTFDEFKESRLMEPQHCSATKKRPKNLMTNSLPDSFDWGDKKMVTPVKDQGQCGSCWAFSTVAAMESHWNVLGKGQNETFSEQQLVDCAGNYSCHGCFGGLPSRALQYIKDGHPLMRDRDYKYHAKKGDCAFDKDKAVGYAKYASYNISEGDEHQMQDRLANVGPVSLAFEVIYGFKQYHSGVFRSRYCSKSTLLVNHAVLATGYGIEAGTDFWKVKNSWGPEWGLDGYFLIERGTNMCGLALCASHPLIDSPSTSEPVPQTA